MTGGAMTAGGPALRWTDAHCHLEYRSSTNPQPEPNPHEVDSFLNEVDSSAQAGVFRLIDVGTDEQRSRLACQHSARHENVWATVGLHPHDAVQGWDWVQPLAQQPDIVGARIVGVGECGLDYHYDHSPRPLQQESFAAQVRVKRGPIRSQFCVPKACRNTRCSTVSRVVRPRQKSAWRWHPE
jgi:TatD DNase family protein